jgi:hypothetical protein
VRLLLALATVACWTLVAGAAAAAPAEDCSGSGASCAVLTIAIEGHGTVTTPAGTCTSGGASAACTQTFPLETALAVTAAAGPGALFAGWSGACSGKGECSVTMGAARSITARFTAAPPPPPLGLTSLGEPLVRALSVGYLVTVRFSTTRAGTARLRIVGSGRPVGTITFDVRAGRRSFGPFLVRERGGYRLTLAFTDLSGRTKSLGWKTCLGTCVETTPPAPPAPPPPATTAPPPPPPPATTSGSLRLLRGEAALQRRASGASVTLHFTANEQVTVVVSVLRNSKLVLKGLRFSFPAGAAKIGPFAINRAGSYSFRLVANDGEGRNAALRWDVRV